MSNVMSNIGKNEYEGVALFVGVLGILSSAFFLLVKFEVINLNILIDDSQYLWFFAIFTGISGIVHLLTTIGLIGSGK